MNYQFFSLFRLLCLLCFSVSETNAQKQATEFLVRIEAKNPAGELVPATLTITSESTGLSQKGSLKNGAYTVALKTGTYEVEANHENYRTTRQKFVLTPKADSQQQEVSLIMAPRQATVKDETAPVTVRIIDQETGRPLTEGFDIRVEDLTRGQPISLVTANKNTITFRMKPLHQFRFVVKANGYQPYRYESEARISNDIIIQLRRGNKTPARTYTLRLIDDATQGRIRMADILLKSQYDKVIDLKRDRNPGEWIVQLDDTLSYTLTVRAVGYEPLDMKLPRPNGPLILLPMRSKTDETSGTGETSGELVVTGRPLESVKPPKRPANTSVPKSASTLTTGRVMTLDNVYFDQSSYLLRPESYAQLNQLVGQLASKPSVRIEVAGHTDNVGDYRLNQLLSENRARVIANYLISKGIAESRIEHRGYGSDQPIAPNDSEENKRRNRRVEVRILSE